MGKNKKDACGGHRDRDKEYSAGTRNYFGWTPKFKRWAKDHSNRGIRRQAKAINEQAMLDYYDDLEERRIFERELEEYDMLMSEMYSDYDDHDDFYDDNLHPAYEDEYNEPDYWPGDFDDFYYPDPPVISKPFVYERDLDSY